VVALELLMLSVLIPEWVRGEIQWPEFVFYHAYLTMVIIQLWEVAGAMNKTFKHLGDSEEMAEIYAEPPEVRDAAGAVPLRFHKGEIEFHAVNFSYGDGNAAMAVSDFSLTIEPGETVAVVGPSGAGKSTLVNLFQRLYDVNSGYIRIDGQDIANVTQVSLHQHVATVPQDPNMFHRTIRENILVGRPDATEEEVIVAAKQAHAWEFVSALPSGLDTMVGERGVKLSGGQRQRIALARAFLADRPFLILDEATSALDSATEADIQAAISGLLRNRTCIAIAHRLSTIKKAARIVVMDKGCIVEIGTHKELIERKGLYHKLWQHQSGDYLIA
jgi:ABC-type multidrug transport system fused ATPase/permease subunit